MGSFSIWHWLVLLVIIALVFGTKKLRNVGEDLGAAIKSFKKGMQDGGNADNAARLKADPPAESPAEHTTKSERAE